jgi:hypothetical protein
MSGTISKALNRISAGSSMVFRKEFLIVVALVGGLFAACYYKWGPIQQLMNWRSTRNVLAEKNISLSEYQMYDYTEGKEPELTVDFLKGKYFWNPQVAIWLEDSTGNYLETLLVTTSTARGLFYSGRSAKNFKQSDTAKEIESTPTRRVDALPYWSHKRGHQYPDGFYSPPTDEPLPDGITGATPTENFYFKSAYSSLQELKSFKVLVEVNVAFDENEYYSEYDFLEDTLYHSGTGLLGQPSIIYSATIRQTDPNHYYILAIAGHGHYSGGTGEIFEELKTITTAKHIVERIVIGVNENWYKK